MADKRPPTPLLLTAQDLRGGGVVYWTGGGWSARIEDAAVARDAVAADALDAARTRALGEAEVIDVFLAGVGEDRTPRHFRERARVSGPTFRDDFGRNDGVRRVSL